MKAFECQMCGECCYGKGGIYLEEVEIDRIARHLNLTTPSFLVEYCERINGRIYLKSGGDNRCIFFDRRKSCTVHTVKPQCCARWPYYPANLRDPETWEMAKGACPGINPHCSFEEFVRQSKE